MFQSKQFVLDDIIVLNGATTGPEFLFNSVVLLTPDTVMGAAAPIQSSLKKVTVVGIDYYFDVKPVVQAPTSFATNGFLSLFNFIAIYKDTLNPSGVTPDDLADNWINANQVSGTVNQQLFPERVIDRRSFSMWLTDQANGGLFYSSNVVTAGTAAERRVRRRVSFNNREGLFVKHCYQVPQLATGESAAFELKVHGMLTYRLDL